MLFAQATDITPPANLKLRFERLSRRPGDRESMRALRYRFCPLREHSAAGENSFDPRHRGVATRVRSESSNHARLPLARPPR